MIGPMSTSLKVVNMAVVFLASTKRLAMVLRRLLIFSLRTFLENKSTPAKTFLPGFAIAFSTSLFMIFPPKPLGSMLFTSTFLSAIMALATGVAFTSLEIAVTGAAEVGCWLLVAGSFATGLLTTGFSAVSSICANMLPIKIVSPSVAKCFTVPAFSAFTSKVAFSLSSSAITSSRST